MQFTLSFAALALATLAAANPLEVRQTNQCNTGSLQCCQSVQSAASPPAANLLGPLGIAVQGVTALVGLTCSPLSVIGLNSGSCSAQPACCSGDSFNGVVALGCSPINVGL